MIVEWPLKIIRRGDEYYLDDCYLVTTDFVKALVDEFGTEDEVEHSVLKGLYFSRYANKGQ